MFGLCCAPRSRFQCCQNTRVWPAGKQKHQRSSSSRFVCVGPDFIAINTLWSGVVVVGDSLQSTWTRQDFFFFFSLLRRRKKNGVTRNFGCQLPSGVNSSHGCSAMGQQRSDGSYLGNLYWRESKFLFKRAWRVSYQEKKTKNQKQTKCSWLSVYF